MASHAPRAVVATAAVAALVTVVALAAVLALRIERERAEAGLDSALFGSAEGDAASVCGEDPCGVLTSLRVGDATVELLADADGEHGRVRVLQDGSDIVIETALAAMGVRLTQKSLVCVDATKSACLVRGGYDGGVVGEVFVERDNWQPAERPYFSSAAVLDLDNVADDDSAEIVVAQEDCVDYAEDCAGAPVFVEVFALDGRSLGCTERHRTVRELPGWPEVHIHDDTLGRCPD